MSDRPCIILLKYSCLLLLLFSLTACFGTNSGKEQARNHQIAGTVNTGHHTNETEDKSSMHPDPNRELDNLTLTLTTKGPNGEKPAAASEVILTEVDKQKIRSMHLKAAIAMQYMGSDWSVVQVRAIRKQLTDLGVEVVAVTDANFKPVKQIADIESILTKNPDILISIPVDTVATAPAYQKAADQGVKIVFMNQAPLGLRPGKDYVSIVSPDDYGNGARGAHLIARELGGKGKIGIIYHAADFSTTRIRYEAFKDAISKYPGITIVEAQGIAGPDFELDAENAASGMLLRHPDIQAIWGIWDLPAKGIITAARKAGRDDLIITTVDLGKDVAVELAKGSMIKGVGAQTVYEAGFTEVSAALLSVLGKPVPEFIVMDGIATDRTNVLDVWKRVYHESPPKELTAAVQ